MPPSYLPSRRSIFLVPRLRVVSFWPPTSSRFGPPRAFATTAASSSEVPTAGRLLKPPDPLQCHFCVGSLPSGSTSTCVPESNDHHTLRPTPLLQILSNAALDPASASSRSGKPPLRLDPPCPPPDLVHQCIPPALMARFEPRDMPTGYCPQAPTMLPSGALCYPLQ